jgi:UDP-N-acetylmuramoyl-tripeptide--D-alanyl-D-alanine ligase
MKAAFPEMSAALFAEVADGRVIAGDAMRLCRRFAYDSRKLVPGEAFLAIVTDRRDGHAFLAHAIERGASALVVSDPSSAMMLPPSEIPVVLVDDAIKALQRAARYVRRMSGAKVVAITGSAGKTTTKEAAATLVSGRYRTMRNQGNYNNHIGLPLSLMELQDGAEVAVVEFGMSAASEIRTLVEVAEPDVRVWTNVGTAHIEYFETQEKIAAAKAEILERASAETVVVANADDPLVMRHVQGFRGRVTTFGVEQPADVRPLHVDDRGLEGQRAEVMTPAGPVALDLVLAGRANLENVMAAVGVALALGVPPEEIAVRAASIRPAEQRGEVIRLDRDILVYDDSYNASPTALKRTLQVIAAEKSGRRRVAFLGEMRELGAQAESLHRDCGVAVASAGIARLVTVGGTPACALGKAAVDAGLAAGVVTHVENSADAADLVPDLVRGGDLVLVKGSHSTGMDVVVDRLRAEFA